MKIYLLLLALIPASAHADWELILDEKVYSITSDGERLYASTDRGILFSRDDGDTWRPSDYKDDDVEYLAASPDAIYGYSNDHGIIRSVTKGNTWHPQNTGLKVRQWENGRWVARIPYIQQILVTSSGLVVAVCYHSGSWISRDRGDSWHDVTLEWTAPQGPGFPDIPLGTGVWSMGEFDNYLWAQYSNYLACRSLDQGATWERIPYWAEPRSIAEFGSISAWLVFQDNLYVAGHGFGRWREEGLEWEDLSHGLPEQPALNSLVVHGNRIFAGSFRHGVFIFDHHSETWRPAGRTVGHVYSQRGACNPSRGPLRRQRRRNIPRQPPVRNPRKQIHCHLGRYKTGEVTSHENLSTATPPTPRFSRLFGEPASDNRRPLLRQPRQTLR